MIPFIVALTAAQAGLPLTTIARGPLSGIDAPREAVVRSQSEWEALWKAHAAGGAARPLPPVDFRTQMVAGVFLGSRPTAGFEVEILRASRDGDAVVVEYAERKPGRDVMTAQMLTSPFHLVSLARQEGTVRFRRVDK